ncbi:hypothetical protein WMY93_010725 [Mugilogobius chulae]|uniref:Uncharacterized protein n=1 Tax=Mugilogobius chulae TaxID=88201 RepID=A0AAW0PDU2_9GOBI
MESGHLYLGQQMCDSLKDAAVGMILSLGQQDKIGRPTVNLHLNLALLDT